MRIEEITLRHIRMPYVSPFQTSGWTELDRECVIVCARAEGLTGWGECGANQHSAYSYETAKTNWLALEDGIVPAVLDADLPAGSAPAGAAPVGAAPGHGAPDAVTAYRAVAARVNGHPMAKAGLEMALWDLLAQAAGQPLSRFIGGTRERVAVGVSVGIQPTPEKLVETVDGYLAQGYRRIKLKIKPGRDAAEVAAVRRAHPNLLLQVDGNSAYTLADTPALKALDGYGLLLIEQPLASDDIIDHASLQPQLETPICLDESILSVRHVRWALDLGACRIINIKPARVSGIDEAIRIHDYCRARNVPVWMGGMLETGIGRAANVAVATLPGFTLPGDISASARYYAEDIVEAPFVLNREDSTLSAPAGLGLGIAVREDVLDRVTLRRERFARG